MHGNEIVQYLQNYKCHEFDQGHSTKLIEFHKLHPDGKQPFYFLKAVEFWSTFDIHVDITLAIFQEKLQNHIF